MTEDIACNGVWEAYHTQYIRQSCCHHIACTIAYAVGRGVARDMGQAADWFKRAADLGYVDAQYNLGVLYERGDGVPQSLTDAYKWYAVAAAAGDNESKSRISALATQLAPDDLSAAQSAAASFRPEPLNRAANLMPAMSAHG